ncbi:TolC family protein [Adhaeribacter radiodurans]|uniref:TolC family protein n=1 Tax=Adhaeribacter radiodurans TaxID=2745197 RepID=A0A7L7LEB4_9BACT|nr:TolC family protein [Adhaeribacter radiodurans]QMU31202.1 TolC family protein [Adhaeribacter radiodurans]
MFKTLTFILAFLLLFSSAKLAAQQTPRVWSLDSCINQAISQNILVKQSELNLQSSRVVNAQTKAAFLPTSQFNGSHSYNTGRSIDPFTNQPTTDQIQSNNFGLSADLTLFNGGQLQYRLQQSKLGLKASQYELEQTRQTVALNVTLAYLQVLFSQELLIISENQLKNTNLQVERSKHLVDAGALATSTLADLEVQATQDELQEVTAATNLKTARLALLQLLNLPATTDFTIQPLATEVPATNPYNKSSDELIAIAEKIQPGIIGADLRVRSAHQGVRAARASLLPVLGMSGYMGSNYSSAVPTSRFVADGTGTTTREVPSQTDFVLINGTRTPIIQTQTNPNGNVESFHYFDQLKFNMRKSIGFYLSFPILNSWQNRTRLSNALIAEKTAEYAAENVRLQLRQSIELAHSNLEAAQARFQTSTRQVTASKIAYDAAQKRFESGSVHYVDLNLAKTNYDKALSNQVQAKYDYLFRQRLLDFYLQESTAK